jgi:hypothetical protein
MERPIEGHCSLISSLMRHALSISGVGISTSTLGCSRPSWISELLELSSLPSSSLSSSSSDPSSLFLCFLLLCLFFCQCEPTKVRFWMGGWMEAGREVVRWKGWVVLERMSRPERTQPGALSHPFSERVFVALLQHPWSIPCPSSLPPASQSSVSGTHSRASPQPYLPPSRTAKETLHKALFSSAFLFLVEITGRRRSHHLQSRHPFSTPPPHPAKKDKIKG